MVGSLTTLLAGVSLALGQAPSVAPVPTALPPAPALDASLPAPVANPDGCGCGDGGCCGKLRLYGGVEYLLWWIRDSSAPVFVTSGPATATPVGALGANNGTTVLFDGTGLASGLHSGGRFTAGVWLDEQESMALEANYFFLASTGHGFTAGPTSTGVLAVPFFNTETGLEDSQTIALPGSLTGKVSVGFDTKFSGAELNLTARISEGGPFCVDLLGGFRYLRLDESLTLESQFLGAPGFFAFPGSKVRVQDFFRTRNDYYGGQFGVRGQYTMGRATFGFVGKAALGSTVEALDIQGNTVTVPPGGTPTRQNGGLLALPTNSGTFRHDAFAFVPELGLTAGYQVTDHVRAYVGYTFLYDSNVLRAGDAVNRSINPTQSPTNVVTGGTLAGNPLPAPPPFRERGFWAQGFSLGVEFAY